MGTGASRGSSPANRAFVRWGVIWLAVVLVVGACGGDSESPPGQPTGQTAAPMESVAASSTTSTAPETTPASTAAPTTAQSDPFAVTEPLVVSIEGTCRTSVFREDENGTTWLAQCALAHGTDASSVHPLLASTSYDTHFRRVVDDDELVAIALEGPLIRTRLCGWSSIDFSPLDAPLIDDEITHGGVLDGTEMCEGLSWTYTFTWNVESDAVSMEGVLQPGGA